jgi:protein-S-isoprenylcysteine O-methyltransferase Ste14
MDNRVFIIRCPDYGQVEERIAELLAMMGGIDQTPVMVYLIAALLVLLVAFATFRIFVRRDYQRKGRLTPFTSFLELLIWGLFVCFPYIYNPSDWWLAWFADTPVSPVFRIIGLAFTTVGMAMEVIAIGALGVRKTMGQKAEVLAQVGLYRVSRNPQIVGGGLAVVGIAVLWPSWYALGWVVLYGVIAHMMVLTEEEHLHSAWQRIH